MPVIWRRVLIFTVSLLPLLFIVYETTTNQLGADPAKAIVLFTGTWAFYFLLITLSVSPLKRLASQSWLMTHRRMLGLFTLFYAIAHLLSYLIFILGLDFSSFGSELVKSPYILLTIPAIALLIALGATSTQTGAVVADAGSACGGRPAVFCARMGGKPDLRLFTSGLFAQCGVHRSSGGAAARPG